MELWIRSQDKSILFQPDGLYYDYQQDKHHITGFKQNDYYWLGIYKTKERTLEVLDEIQQRLTVAIHENNIDYQKADLILKGKILDMLSVIYEMPEK